MISRINQNLFGKFSQLHNIEELTEGAMMLGGYTRKILWVDLTNGKITTESLEENFLRKYLGGYGVAARLIYDRQKSGIDALGPDNIFGLITGPLTGTPATAGARFAAVGKSPLTGGWGDANSGGHFGPFLSLLAMMVYFLQDKPPNRSLF